MRDGYLKYLLPEFILLAVCTWSVAQVGYLGFFLPDVFEIHAVSAPVVLVLLAALYFVSYRRSRLVVGIIVYVILMAVLVIACLSLSTGENVYLDDDGNYLYFALVTIFAATGGFLLTRTTAGNAVWFVCVAMTCSVVQAFYRADQLGLSLVALFTALTLLILRNFNAGLTNADTVQKVSATPRFAAAVAPVALAAVCALAAWFFIIAPLGPGALHITLITDYRKLPTEEIKGAADELPDYNLDMTSNQVVDDDVRYTTDSLLLDENAETIVESKSIVVQNPQQEEQSSDGQGGGDSGGTFDDYSDDMPPEFDPISYSQLFPWIWLVILVIILTIAAIVAFFVLRRRRRIKKLEGMLEQEDPREQVRSIYLFLQSRLSRLGFRVPPGQTLDRFARGSARRMDVITDETRVSYETLTDTYVKCVYGDYEPTEDEIVPFVAFYLQFWKAARSYLGNVRYFFKSFRL